MPFPPKLAKWVLRASGERSMGYFYTEEHGFQRSPCKAEQVHHIYPESLHLEQGIIDPNTSPAIPLSRDEHVGMGFVRDENMKGQGRVGIIFERGHSFHPDMGKALYEYRQGDKNAFKKAGAMHHVLAKKGERFVNSDEGSDRWLSEQAQDIQWKYHLENPSDPKPIVKPHKLFVRKHWTDSY